MPRSSVAYVAVVVRARLADVGTALEEAAADLYAPPWKVFAVVTVPLLMPALVAGWLLAFTLSLDDVVVASFTSRSRRDDAADAGVLRDTLGVTPEIYALATVIVVGGGGDVAGGDDVRAVAVHERRTLNNPDAGRRVAAIGPDPRTVRTACDGRNRDHPRAAPRSFPGEPGEMNGRPLRPAIPPRP